MAGLCIAQSAFLGQIIKDRMPTTSGTSNYSADTGTASKAKDASRVRRLDKLKKEGF